MPKKEIVTYTHCDVTPEIMEYKKYFDIFDKEHKGTITINDINKIMEILGYEISKKEVEEMVVEIDSFGDWELDFKEFVTLIQKYKNKLEYEKDN